MNLKIKGMIVLCWRRTNDNVRLQVTVFRWCDAIDLARECARIKKPMPNYDDALTTDNVPRSMASPASAGAVSLLAREAF